MEAAQFYAKAFVALFVLVNPLEGIPLLLAATQQSGMALRVAIARRASLAITLILLTSIVLGRGLLEVFGVSIGAFQAGGGAVLFLIALRMVFSATGSPATTAPPPAAGLQFAIVPLAVPLLAGPGAIAGAILYGTRVHSVEALLLLGAVVLAVGAATYLSLRAAVLLASRLKGSGISIATSLMGLIIAAIAVEMIATGVAQMFGLRLYGAPSSF